MLYGYLPDVIVRIIDSLVPKMILFKRAQVSADQINVKTEQDAEDVCEHGWENHDGKAQYIPVYKTHQTDLLCLIEHGHSNDSTTYRCM